MDDESDARLGNAERQYYTDMCDQLFRKYTSFKMRNAEGGGAPESRVVKCFAGAASSAVATCKLCRASVRRGAKGSVANLVAHLQERHEKEFAEMVEEEA